MELLYATESVLSTMPAVVRRLVERLLPSKPQWSKYLRARLLHLRRCLSRTDALDLQERATPEFSGKYLNLIAMIDFERLLISEAAEEAFAAAQLESSPAYKREYLVSSGLYSIQADDRTTGERRLQAAYDAFLADPSSSREQRSTWHYLNYFLWQAYYEDGKIAKDLPYLAEATRTAPRLRRGEYYFELGQAHFNLSNYREAAVNYRFAAQYGEDPEVSQRWAETASKLANDSSVTASTDE